MENDGNQKMTSLLCKAGCGFFGSTQFDGMCSKCYKELVKRTQVAPADGTPSILSAGISSPSVAASSVSPVVPDTTPSVETALPTVTSISRCEGAAAKLAIEADASTPASSGGEDCDSGTESPMKSRKRTRCFTCKKKVGLLGFECRCGGMFCSNHRYSNEHSCNFNYKEHGADHIRKNNPLVVGSKVQKL